MAAYFTTTSGVLSTVRLCSIMRFYEDLAVGETDEFGAYDVTKEEIIEFGEKYDPQPFHTDEAAAKDSVFGELVASGWQTGSICMRLIADNRDSVATLAGIGLDDLRWHAPLAAGDTLHVRIEVVDKRPEDGRDDRGYVTLSVEGYDQTDELLISYEATTLVERRDE